MSDNFEKAAGLTQTLLLSLLGGAGAYAGLQTLQRSMQRIHGDKPKENAVQLQMADPAAMDAYSASSPQPAAGGNLSVPQLGKVADGDPWAMSNWAGLPLAGMAVGLPAGFLGAKALYDKYQTHENQKEVDAAKQQYVAALHAAQSANQKMASETPAIDGLCEEISKQANWSEIASSAMAPIGRLWQGTSNAFKSMSPQSKITARLGAATVGGAFAAEPAIHGVGSLGQHIAPGLFGMDRPADGSSVAQLSALANKSPYIQEQAAQQTGAVSHNFLKTLGDKATLGLMPQAANTWEALALGTGAASLGAGVYMHNKKKEREEKAQYPTSVAYADK